MIDYDPSFAARVRDMAMLGATDREMSQLLGIPLTRLKAWQEKYPDFASAWLDGKLQADIKVAGALFKRACGFTVTTHKETKDGLFREETHYPPDVKACTFWLTNRRPDEWQNKIEHDIGDKGKHLIDKITEMEAARRIAYALTKATQGGDDNGNATS